MSKTIKDSANYRKLSEPMATSQEADAALEAFWEELYELRNKHRITDVSIVFRVNYLADDGQEASVTSTAHYGDVNNHEAMMAFGLGQAAAERQERVGKMIEMAGGIKRQRNKK